MQTPLDVRDHPHPNPLPEYREREPEEAGRWWKRRVAASAGLSLFFLVAYIGAQFLADRRASVPEFYFSWEPRVPLVPLAILPYLSIDLFFVAAPFLIRADRSLRTFSIRVIAAMGVAAVVFVAMPLRCGYPRPAVAGWLGPVFRWFWSADQSTNELPSLHVALLLIVGDVYLKRFRGWGRPALMVWFGLIGASPLLVHQHQVTDLVAGLALGLLCLHFVRDDGRRPAFESNRRVAGYYTAGAVGAISACVFLGKNGWFLWWPALSLSLLALGYWFVGPRTYGKTDGRLSSSARLLLWPALLGQHASLWWYRRQCRPWDRVTDKLWIGRQLSRSEAARAVADGVGAVIDLTCEFDRPPAFRGIDYLNLPTMDLTAPTPAAIAEAVEFVRQRPNVIVYVHCKVGYSRTAVIAAAVLLATRAAATAEEAITRLRAARPTIIVRPEARRAINVFAERLARETLAAAQRAALELMDTPFATRPGGHAGKGVSRLP